jgi:3-deoxy-D-manno-octulosonic-acid transferase
MALLESLYAGALRTLGPALPQLAAVLPPGGKLARGLRGREHVVERFEAWASDHRDPRRALVWFHAPSVGEGLQARAVITALRARRPELQVVYTFFSPSAAPFSATVPADVTDYLPLDAPDAIGRVLDALRPAVIAFGKSEVWPVLTRAARARGIRLALLSATLPRGSSRLGPVAARLLAPAYARLDAVGAISPDDADRLRRIGVHEEALEITGDARFDQVLDRARGVDRASPLLRALAVGHGVTVVAGSTWPADERRLLPAVARLREAGIPLRLVLAPHEPTDGQLRNSADALTDAGLPPPSLLSGVEAGAPCGEVVLVDRVGVLGELYALADVAYVGGGWGRAGLHSVLEPAAFGVPVAFGPRHANAREAAELVAAGAAHAALSGDDLARVLERWCSEDAARGTAGAAATGYVSRHAGAALRGAELVERLVDREG